MPFFAMAQSGEVKSIVSKTGDRYKGNVANGKPSGRGKTTYKNVLKEQNLW